MTLNAPVVASRWVLAGLSLALVVGFVLAPATLALQPELKTTLVDSGRVAPELIERLGEVDRVGARVLFTVPADAEAPLPLQSEIREDVDPIVVDLARQFVPGGEMSLTRSEVVRSLTGVVDGPALLGILENRHVLAVELEDGLTPREDPEIQSVSAALHPCIATSIVACVQGGRFNLRVSRGGVFQRVAATSADSATFWFFGSNNWEVLAKVLNGCNINNRYWVYAAGATTQAYTLHVLDGHHSSQLSKTYSGSQCPIVDISTFPC